MKIEVNASYEVYDSLPEELNLVEYLFSQIKSDELDRVAFIQDEKAVPYRDLILNVKKFSFFLKEVGVQAETRVAILLPDDLSFVYGFLAIIWLGGIAVMINPAYSDEDIEYILKDASIGYIISESHWHNKLSVRSMQNMQWILVDVPDFFEKFSTLQVIKEAKKSARESAAFWVYTSGSTGRPKGVIHSHYNPIVAIQTYGKHVLKLSEHDIVLSASPMAFSYALGTSIYFPIFSRSTVVISRDKIPFEYIKLINKHAVSVFFGVPHTYASIYAISDILPLSPGSLRLCVSAGEQLPATLWENWKNRFGIIICEGIGTTESTHIFISNTVDAAIPGSSGRAVPGYVVCIVNDEGDEILTENTVGLLKITGEGFMLGYWNQLKATQRILHGQTMITGDLYSFDKDRNYYFIGRKDNLIKVKGMWVTPVEIESVIMRHPLIMECSVLIEPGIVENTIEIVAYITLKENQKFTRLIKNEIVKLANANLPKFKLPKKIFAVNNLPRTATGKVNRHNLLLTNMARREKYETC